MLVDGGFQYITKNEKERLMSQTTAAKMVKDEPWDPRQTQMPEAQIEMIERKCAERDLWGEMKPLLDEAGLSPIPGKVNGRQYILVPTGDGAQESPRGIVSGTVTGYYVDSLGNLTLCLSAPYAPAGLMVRKSGKWELQCPGRKPGQRNTQECQFQLL